MMKVTVMATFDSTIVWNFVIFSLPSQVTMAYSFIDLCGVSKLPWEQENLLWPYAGASN